VVDRGFSSRENLGYLQRAGGHCIAGERMRDGGVHAAEALAREGRYQQVRDNLRVKEVKLDSTPGVRWIICHNPEEAERDQATREAAITRITTELDRITAARTRAREQARARRASTATMTAAARRRRGSSGRFCHSAMPSTTLSVMVEIVCGRRHGNGPAEMIGHAQTHVADHPALPRPIPVARSTRPARRQRKPGHLAAAMRAEIISS
jgi:hypothetical protein